MKTIAALVIVAIVAAIAITVVVDVACVSPWRANVLIVVGVASVFVSAAAWGVYAWVREN